MKLVPSCPRKITKYGPRFRYQDVLLQRIKQRNSLLSAQKQRLGSEHGGGQGAGLHGRERQLGGPECASVEGSWEAGVRPSPTQAWGCSFGFLALKPFSKGVSFSTQGMFQ